MFMANTNLVNSLINKNNRLYIVDECEIDVELNKYTCKLI